MKILMVASEVFPYAKTGGLADVTGALSKALRQMGHDISIVMPKYQTIDNGRFGIKPLDRNEISVPISNRLEKCNIYKTLLNEDIPVYFLDNKKYYNRPNLYGTSQGNYEDNAERFIFFSRAILETCKHLNYKPDIIHCNDWHTGLVPAYIKTLYNLDPLFKETKTLFTIHNLAYQGQFWYLDMHLTNLGWDAFTPEGIEFYGKINFLKSGIVYSDMITTVSKTYSKEIQQEALGEGMHEVLKARASIFYGINNGIDCDEWDPAIDDNIKKTYTPETLEMKKDCKKDLLKNFGLPVKLSKPVIGMISRLTDQKGFDLIVEVMEDIIKLDAYFILLGTGDEKYHNMFQAVKEKYPDSIGLKLGFDANLAHKIEAGADMFLMPSRYEPCGLNQMYSLKYGTIPIVRAVGGLNDTVINYTRLNGKFIGNGFKFKKYSAKNMMAIIKKAVKVFSNKLEWNKLMIKAMKEDHSWNRSAGEYVKLYAAILGKN